MEDFFLNSDFSLLNLVIFERGYFKLSFLSIFLKIFFSFLIFLIFFFSFLIFFNVLSLSASDFKSL